VLLAPLGFERAAGAVERLVAPVTNRLPEATTLREAPRTRDVRRPGLLARTIEPGIVGTPTGPRLAERRARLVLVADQALSSARLELGREAPVAIGVRGGRAGNTTIRPSGEISLDVLLDPGEARRHPVWWSRSGAFVYPLELELPGEPERPIPIDLAFGRAAAAGAEPIRKEGAR
jgi:hypothetical protein